tara:strand:- start:728 stop:1414 length:687 start_codon:yes stop_codon:yes gene_type:complete
MSEEGAEGEAPEDCAEESSLEERVEESEGESRERTDDGVIIIIANKDGTTLYETKPDDYFDESQIGTHQPIGGHIDSVDGVVEDPKTAAKREVTEEVSSKAAQEIINKYLEDETPYAVVQSPYGTTHIYAIIIEDDSEWSTVSSSRLGDDAGSKAIIPLEQLLKMDDKEFSFNYGPTIKRFARENFNNVETESNPSYVPTNFNDTKKVSTYIPLQNNYLPQEKRRIAA